MLLLADGRDRTDRGSGGYGSAVDSRLAPVLVDCAKAGESLYPYGAGYGAGSVSYGYALDSQQRLAFLRYDWLSSDWLSSSLAPLGVTALDTSPLSPGSRAVPPPPPPRRPDPHLAGCPPALVRIPPRSENG